MTGTESSDESRATIRVFVTGRVQGVGFRDFVQRRAFMLGVSGWVRNHESGRAVEIEATGTRAALEQLLGQLRTGPRLAHVTDVQVEWLAEPVTADRFEIRY